MKLLAIIILFFSSVTFADELIIEPDSGRAPILAEINHANSSIDLVMYGLTDTVFMQALAEAHLKHKKIHILLEPHPYKSEDENWYARYFFKKMNIAWHASNPLFKFTHQKTFLFDHQSALVMTFNLTHSSFKKQRNFGLILKDPRMVAEIEHVFNSDWQGQTVTVHHPNLIWSPDNSREKILDFLNQAKNEIKVYAEDLSDFQMVGVLAKAARKGIKVHILMSQLVMNHSHLKRFDYLTQAGVIIHFHPYYIMHAKVIIVDQRQAILGSINLTQSSLEKNRELSVIIKDSVIIKQLLQVFKADWEAA